MGTFFGKIIDWLFNISVLYNPIEYLKINFSFIFSNIHITAILMVFLVAAILTIKLKKKSLI